MDILTTNELKNKDTLFGTFYKMNRNTIETISLAVIVIACFSFILYGIIATVNFIANVKRDIGTVIGFFGLCLFILIAILIMIYLITDGIFCYVEQLRKIQKLPITKEEFVKMGCETREDVLMYLMFYRDWDHKRLLSRKLERESFSYSYLPEELNDQLYCTIACFEFKDESLENSRYWYCQSTKEAYMLYRPGISSKLLTEYDACYNKYLTNK